MYCAATQEDSPNVNMPLKALILSIHLIYLNLVLQIE